MNHHPFALRRYYRLYFFEGTKMFVEMQTLDAILKYGHSQEVIDILLSLEDEGDFVETFYNENEVQIIQKTNEFMEKSGKHIINIKSYDFNPELKEA